MTARNRLTPFGTIERIDQRGLFLGNRGCLHRGDDIVRPWQVRRWITCALAFRGWRAPTGEAGRWTPLFAWDDAVALAAGHRPCARCRHADHVRWMDGWEAATGGRPPVDAVDRALHGERVGPDGRPQVHHRSWPTLPAGTFVVVDDVAHLVLGDRLVPWRPTAEAYGAPVARPRSGRATVLTPSSSVAVVAAGYEPLVHPSVPAP